MRPSPATPLDKSQKQPLDGEEGMSQRSLRAHTDLHFVRKLPRSRRAGALHRYSRASPWTRAIGGNLMASLRRTRLSEHKCAPKYFALRHLKSNHVALKMATGAYSSAYAEAIRNATSNVQKCADDTPFALAFSLLKHDLLACAQNNFASNVRPLSARVRVKRLY